MTDFNRIKEENKKLVNENLYLKRILHRLKEKWSEEEINKIKEEEKYDKSNI